MSRWSEHTQDIQGLSHYLVKPRDDLTRERQNSGVSRQLWHTPEAHLDCHGTHRTPNAKSIIDRHPIGPRMPVVGACLHQTTQPSKAGDTSYCRAQPWTRFPRHRSFDIWGTEAYEYTVTPLVAFVPLLVLCFPYLSIIACHIPLSGEACLKEQGARNYVGNKDLVGLQHTLTVFGVFYNIHFRIKTCTLHVQNTSYPLPLE